MSSRVKRRPGRPEASAPGRPEASARPSARARPSEWALLRSVVYYRACAQLERHPTLWRIVLLGLGLGLLLALGVRSHQSAEPGRRAARSRDEAPVKRAAGSHLSAAEAQVAAAGAALQAQTPRQQAEAAKKTFSLLTYSASEAELKAKFGSKAEPGPLYTLVYDTKFDLRLERLAEVIVLELPKTTPLPIVVMLPSERQDGSIFPTASALAAAQIDPNCTCIVQTQALRKQYRAIRDGIRRVESRDGKPSDLVATAWWMVHDIFIEPATKPLLLANKDNLEIFATERVDAGGGKAAAQAAAHWRAKAGAASAQAGAGLSAVPRGDAS